MMRMIDDRSFNAKKIATVLSKYVNNDTIYVEPFCGTCVVAREVVKMCRPMRVILSDNNIAQVKLMRHVTENTTNGLPYKYDDVNRIYDGYREKQNMDDHLTALFGYYYSEKGHWFKGMAGDMTTFTKIAMNRLSEIDRIANVLRTSQVQWHAIDYDMLDIPNGSVVYLDPPGVREMDGYAVKDFDYDKFWEFTKDLAKRCIVVVTTINYPEEFTVVEELDTRRGKTEGYIVMLKKQSSDVRIMNTYIDSLLSDYDGMARYDLLPKRGLMEVAHHAHTTIDKETGKVKAMTYTSEELIEMAKILIMCDNAKDKLPEITYDLLMAIWHEKRQKK